MIGFFATMGILAFIGALLATGMLIGYKLAERDLGNHLINEESYQKLVEELPGSVIEGEER